MLPEIVEIFRKRGPESFTLGTIAEELGTSSRMLIYHFGGRDELLGRVMKLVRKDTIDYLEDPPPRGAEEAMRKFWSYYVDMGHITDMQLFFHIAVRRVEEPQRFTDFASTAVDGWTEFFAHAIEREGKSLAYGRALGRLMIDVLRGILVDYLITDDVAGAERSLDVFCGYIRLLMDSGEDLGKASRQAAARRKRRARTADAGAASESVRRRKS